MNNFIYNINILSLYSYLNIFIAIYKFIYTHEQIYTYKHIYAQIEICTCTNARLYPYLYMNISI